MKNDLTDEFADLPPVKGWKPASAKENVLAFCAMVALLAVTVMFGIAFISSITAMP